MRSLLAFPFRLLALVFLLLFGIARAIETTIAGDGGEVL